MTRLLLLMIAGCLNINDSGEDFTIVPCPELPTAMSSGGVNRIFDIVFILICR